MIIAMRAAILITIQEPWTKNKEEYQEHIGKISYNRDCGYRRGLFNTGLNIEYQGKTKFIMNAVTGYQNLTDRM